MVWVRNDFEGHEVAVVQPPGRLKIRQQSLRGPHHPQVNVARGARPLEPELEDEPAFQRRRVSADADDSREEAVKDQQLAPARE